MTGNELRRGIQLYQESERLSALLKELNQPMIDSIVCTVTIGSGQPHHLTESMKANLRQSVAIEAVRAKNEFQDFTPHNEEVM